jgi:hypothetical protein
MTWVLRDKKIYILLSSPLIILTNQIADVIG